MSCSNQGTQMWIMDSGASTAEIEAGVRAARAVLEEAGVAVSVAADPDASDASSELWQRAELAAFEAAFAGWARWPEHAVLVPE